MAGEACIGGQKRKSKLSRQESAKSGHKESEIEIDRSVTGGISAQTRGGIRVYKIVVLGDGGVGKSGESYTLLPYMLYCLYLHQFVHVFSTFSVYFLNLLF